MTSTSRDDTTPRSGDGSLPAEDDTLLRQPADEGADDPDLAGNDQVSDDQLSTELDDESGGGSGGADHDVRPGRPDDPAEGPDDPAYTR